LFGADGDGVPEVMRLIWIAALLILAGLAGWMWQDRSDLHTMEQPKIGAIHLLNGGHDV
jgi:hypothetical protein